MAADGEPSMEIEQHNLAEIQRTNQRGGRCLSVIDLIEAGTITVRMAALCWLLIENGASFLTGAVPGGAGKSTLMAALLGLLPPGERIVTAHDENVVEQAARRELPEPLCLLAHEIGDGMWYAYIWGRTARRFFGVRNAASRRVSCLHADTPEEAAAILDQCAVEADDYGAVELQLFIRPFGGPPPTRRVTAMHVRLVGELTQLFRWDEGKRHFRTLLPREKIAASLAAGNEADPFAVLQRWDHYENALEGMTQDGTRSFEDVRARVRTTYEALPQREA